MIKLPSSLDGASLDLSRWPLRFRRLYLSAMPSETALARERANLGANFMRCKNYGTNFVVGSLIDVTILLPERESLNYSLC